MQTLNDLRAEELKDKEFAVEYLNAVMEEGDGAHFLEALKRVLDAQGASAVITIRHGEQDAAPEPLKVEVAA